MPDRYVGGQFGAGVRNVREGVNTISKQEYERRRRQQSEEAFADLPLNTFVEGDEGGTDLSRLARGGRLVKSPNGRVQTIGNVAERDYYLRRMAAEESAQGMSGSYDYASQLEGEALRSARHEQFNRDLNHRDQMGLEFEAAYEMMDTTGEDTDDDNVPAQNQIRRVAEDLISVMESNLPDATLAPVDPIDPTLEQEEYRIKAEAVQETARNMDRAVRGIEKLERDIALTSDVIFDSVVAGVGYKKIDRLKRADVRRTPGLARLLDKDMSRWTKRDWDLYDYYSDRPTIEVVPPEQVIWQAHVADVKNLNMLRVHRARSTNLKWLRDQYEDSSIAPGTGTFAMEARHGTSQYRNQRVRAQRGYDYGYGRRNTNTSEQAGFLETWELEPFVAEKGTQFFMRGGATAAQQTKKIFIDDVQMVYTAITTNRLLERKIIPSSDGVMELPFIPHYVKKSRRHPYGFSVVRMLYWAQIFINHMRSLTYQQAENNAMRMIAIMLDKLGADDDPEQIVRTLKENGVLPVQGNRNMKSINEAVQALNFGDQGINSALGTMMQQEKQTMNREGQTIDHSAMRSTRSARGKQVQMAASDRPKNHSASLLANAQERKKERIWRHLQIIYKDKEDAMIPAPNVPTPQDPLGPMNNQSPPKPEDSTMRLNKKETVPVLNTDARGRPMRLPQLKSDINPEGLAWQPKEVVKNDVNVELQALADGRGGLPTDPLQKLNYFMALGQGGLLLSQRTARQYVLPEQLKAVDDAYAAEDREKQMEAQRQELQRMMQQEMQGQGGAGGGEGGGSGGGLGSGLPQGLGPANPQAGPNGEAPSDMAPSPGEQMRQQREDARISM